MAKFKCALISVSDKTGLLPFVRQLVEDGTKVISTGGSARLIREADLDVVDVSEVTGFPEVMDGRVKTLHPRIHVPLLAREGNLEDQKLLDELNLMAIDLVVVNLYPFKDSLKKQLPDPDQIEQIDIGGPTLLRGAAKNHPRVMVLCDVNDYQRALDEPNSLELRRAMAAKVFRHVSEYDHLVGSYLSGEMEGEFVSITAQRVQALRYGENPQQQATWYRLQEKGLHEALRLQGKELSYNNILDIDSALSTLQDFDESCCVAVKHNSPCGLAVDKTFTLAVEKALKADPQSVFGGVIAVNRPVTAPEALLFKEVFLEAILAPSFSREALQLLEEKKNLRLLAWPDLNGLREGRKVRSVNGGLLIQDRDEVHNWGTDWEVRGGPLSPQTKDDLVFAWKVCAHLRSNAIAIAAQGQSLGLGMGQVNRVDAVDQAIQRWQHFHGAKREAVLASDAFFPFPDSVERAAKAGIKWIIQPGGSVKDELVFKRAEELGVGLVLTHRRHFLH